VLPVLEGTQRVTTTMNNKDRFHVPDKVNHKVNH